MTLLDGIKVLIWVIPIFWRRLSIFNKAQLQLKKLVFFGLKAASAGMRKNTSHFFSLFQLNVLAHINQGFRDLRDTDHARM